MSGDVRRSRGGCACGEVAELFVKFNPGNIFDANQVVREPGKRISCMNEPAQIELWMGFISLVFSRIRR